MELEFFNVEESALLYLYYQDSREELISALKQAKNYVDTSEQDLKVLFVRVIARLEALSDEDFEKVKGEIVGL